MPLQPAPARTGLNQGRRERLDHRIHPIRRRRGQVEGQLAVAMGQGPGPRDPHQLQADRSLAGEMVLQPLLHQQPNPIGFHRRHGLEAQGFPDLQRLMGRRRQLQTPLRQRQRFQHHRAARGVIHQLGQIRERLQQGLQVGDGLAALRQIRQERQHRLLQASGQPRRKRRLERRPAQQQRDPLAAAGTAALLQQGKPPAPQQTLLHHRKPAGQGLIKPANLQQQLRRQAVDAGPLQG